MQASSHNPVQRPPPTTRLGRFTSYMSRILDPFSESSIFTEDEFKRLVDKIKKEMDDHMASNNGKLNINYDDSLLKKLERSSLTIRGYYAPYDFIQEEINKMRFEMYSQDFKRVDSYVEFMTLMKEDNSYYEKDDAIITFIYPDTRLFKYIGSNPIQKSDKTKQVAAPDERYSYTKTIQPPFVFKDGSGKDKEMTYDSIVEYLIYEGKFYVKTMKAASTADGGTRKRYIRKLRSNRFKRKQCRRGGNRRTIRKS